MAFTHECWAFGFACTSHLSSPITYFEYVIIPKVKKNSRELKQINFWLENENLFRSWFPNSDDDSGEIGEAYLQWAKAAANPRLYSHQTLSRVKEK